MIKLTNVPAGGKGRIAAMQGDAWFYSRIASIGLTPGCPVEVLRNENILRTVMLRTKDMFLRAIKAILLVTLVFWILSYTAGGSVESSILYRFGTFIEPVTRVIGLSWQTFLAFLSSAIGKEAVLGVLNALYAGNGNIYASTMAATEQSAGLWEILAASISKAEALAFIFATTFNIPCVVALASTHQEVRSAKWTAKIVGYYVLSALVICAVVYRIGLLIF